MYLNLSWCVRGCSRLRSARWRRCNPNACSNAGTRLGPSWILQPGLKGGANLANDKLTSTRMWEQKQIRTTTYT